MDKKGKMSNVAVAAIVVAIGYYLLVVMPGADTGGVTVDTNGGSDTIYCGADVTPDLDFNTFSIYATGTAETGTNNLYRKMGTGDKGGWTTWTQGTAITNLEKYENYEFVME